MFKSSKMAVSKAMRYLFVTRGVLAEAAGAICYKSVKELYDTIKS